MTKKPVKVKNFLELERRARQWVKTQTRQTVCNCGIWHNERAASLAIIGCIIFGIGIIIGWVWTPSLLITPPLVLILFYCSLFWNRQTTIKQHERPNTKYPTSASAIAAYIENTIDEEETRLLSNGSPLIVLKTRLERLLHRAIALRAEVSERALRLGDAPEWLRNSIVDATKVVQSLTTDLERLTAHLEKLRSFLLAARAEVKKLFDPASDINIAQELRNLRAATEITRYEICDIMIQSTVSLNNRLVRFASEIQNLIVETEIVAAAASPLTDDMTKDTQNIKKAVLEYNEHAARLDLTLRGVA